MPETKENLEDRMEVAKIAFDHFLKLQQELMQKALKSPLVDAISSAPLLMAMATTVLEIAIPIDHLIFDDSMKQKLLGIEVTRYCIIDGYYSGEGKLYDAVNKAGLPFELSEMLKQTSSTTH